MKELLIGKKVFILEKDNALRIFSSNWSNMTEDKILQKHGPFLVVDYYSGNVVIEMGLRFKHVSVQDIELTTPLTEAIQE